MLALIGNLDLMELLVIAAAALMIFGRRLPEVAVRAAAQVVKVRRTLAQTWREAGIEDEIRKVKREIDSAVPKVPRLPRVDEMVEAADRKRAREQEAEIVADEDPFERELRRSREGDAEPEPRREPDGEVREDVPAPPEEPDPEPESQTGAVSGPLAGEAPPREGAQGEERREGHDEHEADAKESA